MTHPYVITRHGGSVMATVVAVTAAERGA